MPSLQINNLPDNIYRLLQEKAKRERRSFSQQAVVTLAKGLKTTVSNKERRNMLLREIYLSKKELQDLAPEQLIREDRGR